MESWGDTLKEKSKAQIWLEEVFRMDAMIENKNAEITDWTNKALSITSNMDGERVQSSGNQQKMASAIDKVVDLKREANEMIDKLIDHKQEIIKTIEQLKPIEYDVLHKRYIQGMQFDEIGAVRKKSKSWATTWHGIALKNLNKILDEKQQ